jgi:hypothetical protein
VEVEIHLSSTSALDVTDLIGEILCAKTEEVSIKNIGFLKENRTPKQDK